MAKAKVPIWGTTGKALIFDPTAGERALAAVEALRALLNARTSAQYHKDLLELQVGDDHPQYPMWQARETIIGQWDFTKPIWASNGTAALPAYTFTSDPNTGVYRLGADNFGFSTNGTARWDLDTLRVNQNVYQNIVNSNSDGGFRLLHPSYEGGVRLSVIAGATPSADGIGAELGFWENNAADGYRLYGIRMRHTGELNNEGNLDWYRHNNSTAGVLFLRMTRDSSQVQFNVGSAANPSITYIGRTDDGMYSSAANVIDFATNGQRRLGIGTASIRGLLPFRGEDGSAANPTFSFFGDDDNGMALESANQVGFSAGGTYRFRIATTFVRASVQAQGIDGSVGTPSWSFTSDTNTGRYWVSADLMAESVGGVQRATWSTTTFRLVQDNYELQLGAGPDLRLFHDGTDSRIRNDTGNLLVTAGATEVARFMSTGYLRAATRVGAGIDPVVPFHGLRTGLNGAGPAATMIFQTDAKTVGDANLMALQMLDSANNVTNYAFIGVQIDDPTDGSEDGTILFSTISAGGGPSPRMSVSRSLVRLLDDNQELQMGAGADLRLFHDGTDSSIRNDTGVLKILEGATEVARFDTDSTAGNTRFMVYDVDNGTLERVSVGAADSGGVGFKVLRIPN